MGRPGLHKNLFKVRNFFFRNFYPPVALNDLRSQGAKEGEGEGGEWRREQLERNQARDIQVRRLVLCTGADGMLWCCWAVLVLVLCTGALRLSDVTRIFLFCSRLRFSWSPLLSLSFLLCFNDTN